MIEKSWSKAVQDKKPNTLSKHTKNYNFHSLRKYSCICSVFNATVMMPKIAKAK